MRRKSWKHPETDSAFLNDSRRMVAEKQPLKFGFLFFNSSPIATLFSIISNRTAYLMEVVYDSVILIIQSRGNDYLRNSLNMLILMWIR